MSEVIGQKAGLQMFVLPKAVIGEGCCGNFHLMKGQLGNVRYDVCFAQTAIIIFMGFSSIVIENRFRERKGKQNFNSKLARRKYRLFP